MQLNSEVLVFFFTMHRKCIFIVDLVYSGERTVDLFLTYKIDHHCHACPLRFKDIMSVNPIAELVSRYRMV